MVLDPGFPTSHVHLVPLARARIEVTRESKFGHITALGVYKPYGETTSAWEVRDEIIGWLHDKVGGGGQYIIEAPRAGPNAHFWFLFAPHAVHFKLRWWDEYG